MIAYISDIGLLFLQIGNFAKPNGAIPHVGIVWKIDECAVVANWNQWIQVFTNLALQLFNPMHIVIRHSQYLRLSLADAIYDSSIEGLK